MRSAVIGFALLALAQVTSATDGRAATNARPIAFTKNMGQWPDSILFRADAGGAVMWFVRDGIYYQFTKRISADEPHSNEKPSMPHLSGSPAMPHSGEGRNPDTDSIITDMIKAEFVGANPHVEVVGLDELDYKCNYFLGNDPAKWRTDVANYAAVTLQNIYPGVNVTFRGHDGRLEYSLDGPTEAVNSVRTQFVGATVTIESDGSTVLQTKLGEKRFQGMLPITEGAPLAATSASTQSAANVTLTYSTYLGGASGESGWGIAVDGSGNAYVTGATSSTDFPTQNPYQTDPGDGQVDCFVTKLSAVGNSLVYSTYLGGSDFDGGYAIAVDGNGNAYVTGQTISTNFPNQNPYQTDQGYGDAFVAKLSAAGNSLVYCTYLGGSYFEYGLGIAVDGTGNAYVTGGTSSTNFPTQNPFQTDPGDGQFEDCFVTKLSAAGNSLLYSTYLGGGSHEQGLGIAVDGNGNAYVTGWTHSADFPTQTPYQTYQGWEDAFVTKLSASGNSLVYSTYLGGSIEDDRGYGIAVDGSGNAYVTGVALSTNYPTQFPYQTYQSAPDAFVTKLSASGNSLVYSTYLGGSSDDRANSIAVDGSGNAYVTGATYSTNFPTQNPYQTYQGGGDVFVTKLSAAGNSLLYSTYLGGGSNELCNGVAVDGSGNTYVTGYTRSANFPTQNPYQTFQGETDVFVTKLGVYGGGFCSGVSSLFCDDFDTGPKPDWAQTEGSCSWVATGGTWSASLSGSQLSCVQSAGSESWRNYRFEYSVKGVAGSDKIVRFRDNGSNRYFLNLRSDWGGQDELILGKHANGTETILQALPWPSQIGIWYPVRIDCVDEHISVSVAGIPAISIDDFSSPLYSGGVGLACYTGEAGVCDIEFDNVLVSDPFPHVTIDEPGQDFMIGDAVSLTGRVHRADGSPYLPASGTIGVEDPITSFSAVVPVQADGSFSYTTAPSIQSGVWMFIFGVNSGSGIVRHAYNVPVRRAMPVGDVISSRTIEIPTGRVNRPFSVPADVFSARNMVEPFRVAGTHLIEGAKSMWGALKADAATSWNRVTGSGINHQVLQNMEMFSEKCNPLNPLDGNCANMTASFGWLVWETAKDAVWSKAQEGVNLVHQATPSIMDDCQHALWTQTLTTSQIVAGIAGAASGKVLDVASAIVTTGDLGPIVEVFDNTADKCLPQSITESNPYPFFAAVYDPPFGDIVLLGLIPKIPKAVVVNGYSPINIKVTDQKGRFIDNMSSTIPGAEYYMFDADLDGDSEQVVIVPLDTTGDVTIEITPAPGANPTDTFSVVANYTYYQTPDTVAKGLQVSQIPASPIAIPTFENLGPSAPGLSVADGTMFSGYPCALSWAAVIDPNPGHIVSYDLIVGTSPDFADSVVLSGGTATNFQYHSWMRAQLHPVDTAQYYWKVFAHDDWGAGTVSETRTFRVEFCCTGSTGNLDADPGDLCDPSDLQAIVDYIFFNVDLPSTCAEENDLTGDAVTDPSDLQFLVDYIFFNQGTPPPCP